MVGEPSVSELVKRASEQLSDLVKAEMRTAQAELALKGKRAGTGGGLLGAAAAVGYVGLIGVAATLAAVLALWLDVWAAVLIVTGVFLVVAGVLAVLGRKQLKRAVPPLPARTMDSLRSDIDEIKERVHR
ncbi:phage holin family protein [Streptomyces sp. SP18CS02]|uniref:phage holin family protein n=1 Tax=Streptomyces sp. SP18CS02 TaxID=3002531 RepID=UPI002E75A1D8|nr:phage holin family protein [Streptomyces sp. SP18CS02]MEE1754889.1 phage holin family protein [Streptomyces sp. SP18CS02]